MHKERVMFSMMRFLGPFFPFVLGIFILLFLGSCDPSNKYQKEIDQIDSSLVLLGDIETALNGIEFDSINYMVDHVMQNEDTIRKYYDPDTVSLYIGQRLNECKGVRKTLHGAKDKEYVYRMEIEALRKQFFDLKSDIENGVLKEEKMEEYIQNELTALNLLNESFTKFYNLQNNSKQYFYFAAPVIDSLIIELKNEASME